MEKLNNQTIRHILKDIQNELKELKEIAMKTNGRLTRLELWRSRLGGAMAVIILLLVPILLKFATQWVSAYFK
ncbi:MAG: hypothetical protein AAB922_03390 [Patescibacteria group bacterium]